MIEYSFIWQYNIKFVIEDYGLGIIQLPSDKKALGNLKLNFVNQ